MLSVTITLVPPSSSTIVSTPELVREITHPEPVLRQPAVTPQKKKSVPVGPPVVMLGLKNSLMGEHRELAELTI